MGASDGCHASMGETLVSVRQWRSLVLVPRHSLCGHARWCVMRVTLARPEDEARQAITVAIARAIGGLPYPANSPVRYAAEDYARLIAAAPDLLAALRDIVCFVSPGDDDTLRVLLEDADAAIRRATDGAA